VDHCDSELTSDNDAPYFTFALAAELREARERLGMTVKDLAPEVGIRRHTLQRIFTGERPIEFREMLVLSRRLGVSLDDMERRAVARARREANIQEERQARLLRDSDEYI
jgi:DNA-binding XRE family transcriptional regulator